ncbi:GntR family transcriptional regulator [Actinocorallia sp. A-T 12471]|uniref:GntR family transcriptional regulator n=1 Tax=Actinocorallia sp. A-T 12471 TaxID=3089813 RepID=UPI0029CDCA42|nr:GntR family transcriptional regulator [Actinocorallia sp. A-T 12471]MDX6741181.1 GntR family transcriptional regulator [Actinocorallia sp. A-T 12471]
MTEPSTTGVRPVQALSVVEQVTKEIRRSILSADLRPGQEFSLREIAGRLGVSIIPVREALHHLEGQGLVITARGKSATVSPLSHDDLRAVYRLRRQIEPGLVGRACVLLTQHDHARLRSHLEVMHDQTLSHEEIYEVHHEFHLDLLRPAATDWDLRVLGMLWHAAERYVRAGFAGRGTDPDEPRRRVEAHALLLDAAAERDPGRAAQAVLLHLENNERIAQQAVTAANQ